MWDLDCTPGRLSSESTSSSKGQLFVSFILKGKSLDLTRPDGNPYAKAAGLFIVLQQGPAAFGKSVIKFGEWIIWRQWRHAPLTKLNDTFTRRFSPLYRKGDVSVNNNFSL